MTNCAVCSDPQIGVVSSLLSCGATVEEVIQQTGLEPAAVQFHVEQCTVPVTEDADTLQASDLRLTELQNQAKLCAVAAGLSGDTRSQASALAVGLRIESERRRRLEARLEFERETQSIDGALTIEKLDQLVRDYMARPITGLCYACGRAMKQNEESHEVISTT